MSGYQPVSRIGEVVCNAFVDSYEFPQLPTYLTGTQICGAPVADDQSRETRPMFHEWTTASPRCVRREYKLK